MTVWNSSAPHTLESFVNSLGECKGSVEYLVTEVGLDRTEIASFWWDAFQQFKKLAKSLDSGIAQMEMPIREELHASSQRRLFQKVAEEQTAQTSEDKLEGDDSVERSAEAKRMAGDRSGEQETSATRPRLPVSSKVADGGEVTPEGNGGAPNATGEGDTVGSRGDQGDGEQKNAPLSDPPKKRPAYDRDHLFLKWYEQEDSETCHSHAKIGKKWNDMEKQERERLAPTAAGNVKRPTVIKAIQTAKKEINET